MGLTAKQTEAVRHGAGPERVSDGNEFYLRTYKIGRKAFHVRLDEDGKIWWVTWGNFTVMPTLREFARAWFEQVPPFWLWLQDARCDEMTRQLAMLLLVTGKRTKEARFARWSDFDADRTVWVTRVRMH